jgi:hypothetical protein
MASSSSGLAHRQPIPVGPRTLWPVKPKKSHPSAAMSVGRWGAYWAPSTKARAPAAWAASVSWRMGLMVPSTLDMAVKPSSLAPSSFRSRSLRSSRPWSSMPRYRTSMLRSAFRASQGTRLAWCSISVNTTTSPVERLARPQE